MKKRPPRPARGAEMDALRARLAAAEEDLRAIRSGDVDAVLVTGEGGEQVFTLTGADQAYRQLVETMGEGAVTLAPDGVILYCNARLAMMLGRPLDQVIGSTLQSWLAPADHQVLAEILLKAHTETVRREIALRTAGGAAMPVYLSASRLQVGAAEAVICLVLTDLTEQRHHEEVAAAEQLARSILEQVAEAIVVCDVEGRVIRASQTAQQFCDGSPLRRPFAEAFPLQSETAGPVDVVAVLQGETLRDVDVALRQDGREFALLVNAGPLVRDREILGCVVTLTDITARKRAEDDIREKEFLLSEAQRLGSVGSWYWDLVGPMTWSDETYRVYGVPQGTFEPTVENMVGLIHADDRSTMQAWIGACIAGEQPPELAFRIIPPDGTIRHVLGRGEVVLDAGGEPAYMAGTAQDITELKRLEETLRRSESLLSAMGRIAQVGGWDLDTATLELEWTDEVYRIYDVDRRFKPTLSNVFEFHSPASRPIIESAIHGATEKGESFDLDLELVTAKGQSRWVRAVGRAFNARDRVLGTVQDITARRQAEHTLRLQSAALNAAANAMVITDKSGAIEWSNPAFSKLSGYSAEESLGMRPWDVDRVDADAATVVSNKDMWATILAGDVWHGEVTSRRRDGTPYLQARTVTPVKHDDGEIAHFIAVKEDLTDRRRLESQLHQSQKMETVGQLAGGIAHDFNNLITVINATADLAVADLPSDDPLREELREIRLAGERAAVLTRQLLAFSRKQLLQPTVLSVNTVVANMERLLSRLIGDDIRLDFAPAPDLGNVMADAGQLEQVIVNLVVNARDAMSGGGTLTVSTRNVTIDDGYATSHSSEPGPHVLLAVTDSGSGMDEATRRRIFEPFFTTKDAGKGSGLGLSTVYGIVKQSGGSIDVYSEPGRGTVFKVYLPLVDVPNAEGAATSAAVSARGTETILVVEDDAAVRRVATLVLRAAGYTVLTANNGLVALSVLESYSGFVHLVLTDMVMPEMGGQELATRLAKAWPGQKVLFTSGYTADTLQLGALPGIAAYFIGKPYSAVELARRVREVLDVEVAGPAREAPHPSPPA